MPLQLTPGSSSSHRVTKPSTGKKGTSILKKLLKRSTSTRFPPSKPKSANLSHNSNGVVPAQEPGSLGAAATTKATLQRRNTVGSSSSNGIQHSKELTTVTPLAGVRAGAGENLLATRGVALPSPRTTAHLSSRSLLFHPNLYPPSPFCSIPPAAVLTTIEHILQTRFSSLPLAGGGFSRTRIADIHTFRTSLPPIVPLVVLHGYIDSPTEVDREVDSLVREGVLRRIRVCWREGGIGEGVVRVADYERCVKERLGEGEGEGEEVKVKEMFLEWLRRNTEAFEIPKEALLVSEHEAKASQPFRTPVQILLSAGFISLPTPQTPHYTPSTSTSSSSNCRSTLASLHAISSSLQTHSSASPVDAHTIISYPLTLPSHGPLLRTLSATKSHILSHLKKPKSGITTLSTLRTLHHENPQLNINSSSTAAYNKPATPLARTKKWSVKGGMNGMALGYVLAAMLGEGVVVGVGLGGGEVGVRVRSA